MIKIPVLHKLANNIKTNATKLFFETSTYKSPYFSDSQDDPYNPDDLVSMKGLEIYDKMIKDDQVKAVYEVKKRIVLAKGGDILIDNEDEDEKLEEIRAFIESVFDDLYEGLFLNSLEEILSSIQYGFSVTEKTYKVIPRGKYKGKIGIKHLKTRPPHSIEFHLDDYGNLQKLLQHQQNKDAELNQKKFIIYTYRSEFGNFYGNSDFRAAYTPWYIKDKIRRYWAIFLERNGQPTAIAKYPQGLSKEAQKDLMDMLKNLTAKTVFKLPEGIDVDFKEVTSKGEGYDLAIEKMNIAISRSFLIPELLGFSEHKTGSQALGREQFDMFYISSIERVQKEIEDIINEHLIKDLVYFNYGEQDILPYYKFKPLTERDKTKTFELWVTAIEKGALQAIKEDENYWRTEFNLPIRDEKEEPIEMPKKEKEDIEEDNFNVEQFKEGIKETRTQTKFEKKAGMGQIKKDIEELEWDTALKLSVVMNSIKNSLISNIQKKNIIQDKKFEDIEKLTIPANQLAEFRQIWQDKMRLGFNKGKNTARQKLPIKKMQEKSIKSFPPKEALAYIENQAFRITGTEKEFVLKNAKNILYDALENGKTQADVVFELEKFFNQYQMEQLTAQGILAPIGEIPGRLDTLVRTNFNKAYNMGRWNAFNSPDVKDFIQAFQYSAIMEPDRTTEFCQAHNGKIYLANDPYLQKIIPPNHFNCRSTLVPIVTGEEFETSKHLAIQPASGFGGETE